MLNMVQPIIAQRLGDARDEYVGRARYSTREMVTEIGLPYILVVTDLDYRQFFTYAGVGEMGTGSLRERKKVFLR